MKRVNLIIILVISIYTLRIKDDEKSVKKTSGNNIGVSLYHTQVVTQSMKRPLKWFVNVMNQKPNFKYFEEAEYNGLRYQTEKLRDSLDREYNGYVRDYYDEKLNVFEQKMINIAKARQHVEEK